MWVLWLEGALCLVGLIAISIQWRKERAVEDEIVFRIKAWTYFTLYFYATLFIVLLIPSTFLDIWSDVITLGVMYPPLLLLYFSVEKVVWFWRGVGIIRSGKSTSEVKKKMVRDGVWLVLASLSYTFIVMLYQMEGFIWLSAFLLLVILKEILLNRKP
ncbi:hypothetical protein [Planococcus donghaensis]|uniref:hypothetical protein n=1 Tax=Planococcus donghaensis TaxID=414778 RepID=UPI003735CF47